MRQQEFLRDNETHLLKRPFLALALSLSNPSCQHAGTDPGGIAVDVQELARQPALVERIVQHVLVERCVVRDKEDTLSSCLLQKLEELLAHILEARLAR